jgi:hypothetical protein
VRVLAVARFAELRDDGGWFSRGDVVELFESLRIPAPPNLGATLSGLGTDGMLLKARAGDLWSLTPRGRRRVNELVGEIDTARAAIAIQAHPGPLWGDVTQTVLPPHLAPVKWLPAIRRLLADHEFDQNVFCISRFPRAARADDPISTIIDLARSTLREHRLTLHRADERLVGDEMWENIGAYMWACRYGVALFEDRVEEGLNDNVVIETGGMLTAGRRCALLRDGTATKMPSDFIGQIYRRVDFDAPESVVSVLHRWVSQDLGLGRCGTCPPVA